MTIFNFILDFSKISKIKAKIRIFFGKLLDNSLNNVIKKTQLSTFKIEKTLVVLFFFLKEGQKSKKIVMNNMF